VVDNPVLTGPATGEGAQGTPNATGQPTGTTEPSAPAAQPDYSAQITRLEGELRAQKEYQANYRSLVDRQLNNLRAAPPPQTVAQPQTGYADDQSDSQVAAINGRFQNQDVSIDAINQQTAINSWKVNNPGKEELWNRVYDIARDEVQSDRYKVYGPSGQVDYLKTLEYIGRDLRYQDYEAAQSAAAPARAAAEANRVEQMNRATISGGGQSAERLPAGVSAAEWNAMDSDARLRSGLLPVSTTDPPKPLRPGS